MKKWERLGRKKVFEARDEKTVYMELYQDRLRAPNGKELSYTFYKSSDVSIVVPFLDEEKLVMIKQYRYPLDKMMLEFPAGHVERGESPLATARRELKEETGFYAKKLRHVYSYHPSVSKSRQIVHVFSATHLAEGDTRQDSTEDIQVETVSVSRLGRLIREQKVDNAGTLIAYLLCCTGIKIKQNR